MLLQKCASLRKLEQFNWWTRIVESLGFYSRSCSSYISYRMHL